LLLRFDDHHAVKKARYFTAVHGNSLLRFQSLTVGVLDVDNASEQKQTAASQVSTTDAQKQGSLLTTQVDGECVNVELTTHIVLEDEQMELFGDVNERKMLEPLASFHFKSKSRLNFVEGCVLKLKSVRVL
jgi:hypothetical protein